MLQVIGPTFSFEWFAAFFDGEGCVTICRSRKDSYRLAVSVTQVDAAPIDMFHTLFKGSCRTRWPNANNRMQYEWRANGLVAYEFLQKIRPWLVVKAEQADTAMEWYDLPWRSRRRGAGGKCWVKRNDSQKKVDKEYHDKMRALKKAS